MRSILFKSLWTTTTLFAVGGCFAPPSDVTIDSAEDGPTTEGTGDDQADEPDSMSGPSPEDGPTDDDGNPGTDDAGTDDTTGGPDSNDEGVSETGSDDANTGDSDPGETTDPETGDPETGEPGQVCGDDQITGTEACDDGADNGLALGQCNPGCTGFVQQARIILTADRFSANLGIAGADAACGAGWQAMLSDGSTRIASLSPNQGDGQTGWVLQPYTRYVQSDGATLIGITDAHGLLPATLDAPIWPAGSSWGAWTGMNPDWTPGQNCSGWSTTSADVNGLAGIDSHLSAYLNNGGISNCSHQRHLYCVETL